MLASAFDALKAALATQSVAFAGTTLKAFYSHRIDEAVTTMEFTPEQQATVDARHARLDDVASRVQETLDVVRRSSMLLSDALSRV